ncbi:MAG: cysteine synthase family protein [Burkholderiales bacterium]|nr:cysteine synthase family protein [Burkholderiales bacterium]
MDRHPLQNLSPIATRTSDLIGHTPLMELLTTRFGTRVLLKLEQFNPTGTAKIRMARQMLDEAEAQGLLKPGGWVIESTSGNTGMGLALLAAERGYRFTAVVDHHASKDKLRAMQAFGAELLYVNEEPGDGLATADREALAERIAAEQGAYWTEQHNNPANANGYRAVADELEQALGADITHLIGAVGTGGSLFGTAREMKQRLPSLRVIGVEPVGSIAFGGPGAPYYQSGTGTPEGAEIGELVDFCLLDEGLKVSDTQAFNTARYFARTRAVLLGGSAGGVLYQALKRAEVAPPLSTIVVLVCDGGEKYLDTVFNDEWMNERGLIDPAIDGELDALMEQLTAGVAVRA